MSALLKYLVPFALGVAVLAAYRQLQLELEHFLDLQTRPFQRAVKLPPHAS